MSFFIKFRDDNDNASQADDLKFSQSDIEARMQDRYGNEIATD